MTPALLDRPSASEPAVADGTRRQLLIGAAGLLALGVAACGSDDEGTATTTSDAGTRPVRTERGVIDVPADPQRVVVLNGGLSGSLYALGAKIAATNNAVLGVEPDESGFPPLWSALAQEQGSTPLSGPELQLEAVAAARPDLIVGGGQGFMAAQTEDAYEKLARIAPTVLVSQRIVTWEDQLDALAEMLGAEERAAELVREYDARVAEVAAAITVPPQPTAVLLTTAGDPFVVPESAALPRLLADLGFRPDRVWAKAGRPKLYGTGDSFEVSLERLSGVVESPSVILVDLGGGSARDVARNPAYRLLPAFERGQVHELPPTSYRPDYLGVMETLDLIEAEFGR